MGKVRPRPEARSPCRRPRPEAPRGRCRWSPLRSARFRPCRAGGAQQPAHREKRRDTAVLGLRNCVQGGPNAGTKSSPIPIPNGIRRASPPGRQAEHRDPQQEQAERRGGDPIIAVNRSPCRSVVSPRKRCGHGHEHGDQRERGRSPQCGVTNGLLEILLRDEERPIITMNVSAATIAAAPMTRWRRPAVSGVSSARTSRARIARSPRPRGRRRAPETTSTHASRSAP